MGSPVSPIVANLYRLYYVEKFEIMALMSAHYGFDMLTTPSCSYMNTKLMVSPRTLTAWIPTSALPQNLKLTANFHSLTLVSHINDDSSSTKVTIYRKPTHTVQYLNFESNHHLEHKRVRTLMYRVDKLVMTEEDKELGKSHVKSALKANGYKTWMFKSPKPRKKKDSNASEQPYKKVNVPLLYIKGLSEKLTKIFRNQGVNAYHKPINTIRSFLVYPKHINCPHCTDTYVGVRENY